MQILPSNLNLLLFYGFARPESELIKEVVNRILKRLAELFPRNNKYQLVVVESRVAAIESLLGVAPLLGIWSVDGGIGKTTIAILKGLASLKTLEKSHKD